ncbi:MAG: DUF2148 domain-containing protein [Methanomicrobiales archaeon]|nr:DUF2148 domain-containing protein [Methanomicrobiales archaeon]
MDDGLGAVETIARLMALSARTAPKARGVDALVVRIITGENLILLANEMRLYGEAHKIGYFIRDSDNIRASEACVLVGLHYHATAGLDCGGCGFKTCAAMLDTQVASYTRETAFQGPHCVVRMTDLGIAVGSAVKTAALHNADNRVMYTVGVAALRLGWLDGCRAGYGIPLAVTGKNVFFDRRGA